MKKQHPKERDPKPRPAGMTEAHFTFLDDLRDSNTTNMIGAGKYLRKDMGVSREKAAKFLGHWMETFDERQFKKGETAMSLDYSFGKVHDFKNRCIDDSTQSGLSRDTYALIWSSIPLDMAAIRVNNIAEWEFRFNFLKLLGRSAGTKWVNDNDELANYYPSYDAIADHVGLNTNVRQVTRVAWIRKVAKRVENETIEICERLTKDREKSYGSAKSESDEIATA